MEKGKPKTTEEIRIMREGGRILARILQDVAHVVAPGKHLTELEDLARGAMEDAGVTPAFLGYQGYPCVLCVSVNEEVVHGIATRSRVLREGDIVSIDTGLVYRGLIVDSAVSVLCTEGKEQYPERKKLIQVCQESLQRGIAAVRAGAHVGDIGEAVQSYVEQEGYSVIRSLVGHGVGKELHEPPAIPNYGKKGEGPILEEGMTICVEPMVTAGNYSVQTLADGWTIVTEDGSLSAHFEHTVVVTAGGAEILTHQ